MSGKCYFLLFELKLLYFNDSINWLTAQNKCLSGRMALTSLDGVNVKTSLPELTLWGKRVDLIETSCVEISETIIFRPGITNQANRRHRDQDEISDHCCSCHLDGQP
jgi:hypothetical protein